MSKKKEFLLLLKYFEINYRDLSPQNILALKKITNGQKNVTFFEEKNDSIKKILFNNLLKKFFSKNTKGVAI